MSKHTPVVLCILDGVGWGRRDDTDAVYMADTPRLDALLAASPHCLLRAHGLAVGLPSDADMGNSEVGHNAMGAGRVIEQGAALVDAAIASGRIWESEAWKEVMAAPTVHFLGLVSDGNVHSHVKHLDALIDRAAAEGKRIRVHVLTDGRDVSERSALTWVRPLEAKLAALRESGKSDARVASGGGRMRITMDRYNADWRMVKLGWECHVHGVGRPFSSATEAIARLYEDDVAVTDQWLEPFVIVDERGEPVGRIRDGDAVVLFNFRGDRAIQISRAFEDAYFPSFDRGYRPEVTFAGMMRYDGDLGIPKRYLVDPPVIDQTVGEALVDAGVRTFAVSETQKFGHVTYFFNGNRSGRLSVSLEVYDEVPSDNVPFDQKPEMQCAEIVRVAIEALRSGNFDHVRLNLANGDMVGHTGNFAATVRAMEAVDACLGALADACRDVGAILLVTADHGNADEMFELDKKGAPLLVDGARKVRTSHSLNPVPFILVDPTNRWKLDCPPLVSGSATPGIAQIGGTLLTLFGVPLPAVYLPSLVHE
ncbi:MAG: 2,3-bisphosphoglycerate-independent phosphoglycerate mutase [Pseudomonadota bacterium]|nr:2,3-bisphosphoglycerate-independent phosphoglycerate mutase [Pseudomonadota bacterium]